jgi:hypothetical protein
MRSRSNWCSQPKEEVNKLIATRRAVVEHAFAHLKNWRTLTELRLDVRCATTTVKSIADGRSWRRAGRGDRGEYPVRNAREPQ